MLDIQETDSNGLCLILLRILLHLFFFSPPPSLSYFRPLLYSSFLPPLLFSFSLFDLAFFDFLFDMALKLSLMMERG